MVGKNKKLKRAATLGIKIDFWMCVERLAEKTIRLASRKKNALERRQTALIADIVRHDPNLFTKV